MQATVNSETKYWVGFHRVPNIGPTRLRRLISQFGGIEAAWHASYQEICRVLDDRCAEGLTSVRATISLDEEMARLDRAGIRIVTWNDATYPRLLAEISAPPPLLYVKGDLTPEDQVAVAIVGTRKASNYGRTMAAQLAGDLARQGITIISGLALGIDGAAHEAALRAGGRTIAVLGSGLNVIYPHGHRKLAEEVSQHGAVISDYAPDTQPDAFNFPPRNRIISGLSLGVIVVEAPSRSGALITVDFAADQGRDVFAVPGSPLVANSAGCNKLLRDGARIVTCAEDVLEDLHLSRRQEQVAVQQALPLDDRERRLLALLTGEPQHIDELAAGASMPIAETAAVLLTMQLKGTVRNAGAQHYARSN